MTRREDGEDPPQDLVRGLALLLGLSLPEDDVEPVAGALRRFAELAGPLLAAAPEVPAAAVFDPRWPP